MESTSIAQELNYLKSLFERRLLEDRAKQALIESVQESLQRRDDLDTGQTFAQLFTELLLVVDRCQQLEGTKGDLDSVQDELLDVMTRYGLTEVATETFDPAYQEVIATQSTGDADPGTIHEVVSPGYTLGGRLLRPARVVLTGVPQPADPSNHE